VISKLNTDRPSSIALNIGSESPRNAV
jgi:hypothetical protein